MQRRQYTAAIGTALAATALTPKAAAKQGLDVPTIKSITIDEINAAYPTNHRAFMRYSLTGRAPYRGWLMLQAIEEGGTVAGNAWEPIDAGTRRGKNIWYFGEPFEDGMRYDAGIFYVPTNHGDDPLDVSSRAYSANVPHIEREESAYDSDRYDEYRNGGD